MCVCVCLCRLLGKGDLHRKDKWRPRVWNAPPLMNRGPDPSGGALEELGWGVGEVMKVSWIVLWGRGGGGLAWTGLGRALEGP